MTKSLKKHIRNVKDILTKEQTRILQTSFLLMVPVLLTKITGQIYNLIIASYYGTEGQYAPLLKQFFIANAIPELLTTVLMVGAVGVVIIPVLISSRTKDGEEEFYKVYSYIINSAIITFSIVSFLLIIFAEQIIPFALNLTNSTETLNEPALRNIANMMRVLIFPQLLLGISVFISSGLQVYNRYIVPQLSPLFYNIGRLSVVFTLVPLLDFSPWALVAGTYVGAFLHLIIQIPFWKKLGIKYVWDIDFSNKYLREILKLGTPRVLVLASDQIAATVNLFLSAAFLGGTNALNFARSIYLLVPALFGFTFSFASYPTISKLFIEKKYKSLKQVVQKTLNEMIFLALPFTVTILILRVPLVRLLFGIIPGTELKLVGTYQVAWILLFFAIGLIFVTPKSFIYGLFYAAKDTVTPLIVSIFSLISTITLAILFSNWLSHTPNFAIQDIPLDPSLLFQRAEDAQVSRTGVAGIPLATSIVFIFEFFIMLYLFNRNKVNIGLKKLGYNLAKKFLAAGVMAVFMYYTYKIWSAISLAAPATSAADGFTGSTSLNILILTIVTVVPAFLVYYLMCMLLKVEELKILRKYLNPVFKIGGIKIK